MSAPGFDRVFQLRAASDDYQNLVLQDEEDWEQLEAWLNEERTGSSLTTIAAEVLTDHDQNRSLPPSDFPHLSPRLPIFSEKAIESLQRLLQGNGEILPIVCPEDRYFAFKVTRHLDALNEEDSRLDRFKTSGRIKRIRRYAFFREMLVGEAIFRIPQLRVPVFVTGEFVDVLQGADLVGFQLDPVWEDS